MSLVRNDFELVSDDVSKVRCKNCKVLCSRDRARNRLNTTNKIKHSKSCRSCGRSNCEPYSKSANCKRGAANLSVNFHSSTLHHKYNIAACGRAKERKSVKKAFENRMKLYFTNKNYSSEEAPAADDDDVIEVFAPAQQLNVATVPSSTQWVDDPSSISSMEIVTSAEKNICRLCIKNEGTVPIFQDGGHLRVVAVQIMAVANVKVSSLDGLPSHICGECVNMVHSFFNFKVQCEASDATLRATLMTSPTGSQDHGLSTRSEIATVSNQLNDTRDKLDETRDKLDTLVTSLEGLQQKYCDNAGKSPAHFKCPRRSMKSTPVRVATRPCEVVDITDDADNAKSEVGVENVGNVENQKNQDFKGFSVENGGRTCGGGEVQGKCPQHLGSGVGFSDVPCCYLVELDDESEWQVNCGFPDPAWTRDAQ